MLTPADFPRPWWEAYTHVPPLDFQFPLSGSHVLCPDHLSSSLPLISLLCLLQTLDPTFKLNKPSFASPSLSFPF